MNSPLASLKLVVLSLCLLSIVTASHCQAMVDDDNTRLMLVRFDLMDQGLTLPTGDGVTVTQVEPGFPRPISQESVEFGGKTFNYSSTPTGTYSGHATVVGYHFYGNRTSFSPGVTNVNYITYSDWWSNYLKVGSTSLPAYDSGEIQSYSFLAGGTSELTQRMDYALQRDNVLAAVAMNNAPDAPPLLANCYNTISVGLLGGGASRGLTSYDGTGRTKPEIVAPGHEAGGTATSFATPEVASGATWIKSMAKKDPALVNATNAIVVKAILMGGAYKQWLPSYSRTHTRPLDEVFGAGELDLYSSYYMLKAGEQEEGPGKSISSQGWDYNNTAQTRTYYIDIGPHKKLEHFTALVTWNRLLEQQEGAAWNPTITLADLDMSLYSVDAEGNLVNLIDYSASKVDNVEQLYELSLTEGRYAIQITSDRTDTNYGFAWNGELVPEPLTCMLLVVGGIAGLRRSRR